jgi:hypothetical protein
MALSLDTPLDYRSSSLEAKAPKARLLRKDLKWYKELT